MNHKCPGLFIPWMPTSCVQKSGEQEIEHLPGETQSSPWQLMLPRVLVEHPGLTNARVSQLSRWGIVKDHAFCMMAPPGLILSSAIGCSAPVAPLWGPEITSTEATAINSLQPPFSQDPWPFPAVAPSCNQTVVAPDSGEDFGCVQELDMQCHTLPKNIQFRQIWKSLTLCRYLLLRMGKINSFRQEGST